MRYFGFAVSGKAGAGKSALADKIIEELRHHGIQAKRISFADALKEEVRELFGVEKSDPGGREKLLEWGQKRRDEDLNYWVKKTIEQARHLYASGVIPVIDDLRMPHEFQAVKEFGMLTVRVDAKEDVRRERLSNLQLDTNIVGSQTITEVGLDGQGGWDSYIYNGHGGSLRSSAKCLVMVGGFVTTH